MGGLSSAKKLKTVALRRKIFGLVEEFAEVAHVPQSFKPGITHVPVAGRVYGARELQLLTEAGLDFWLTTGRFNEQFEKRLASFLKIRYVSTTNSGSSANLLAVAALTSPKLGDRALKPDDEVITAAACFPTTVNPLLLYGLRPVFVDVAIPTYNPTAKLVAAAITKKTRAIILAHMLGNPFEAEAIADLAKKHDLWLVEDCCDALGSTYNGKRVGTLGHIGTASFYPAHHITMGEGGALFTQDASLKRLIESFRDWGRDCYCDPGRDNTCGKRFTQQYGDLPKGYDHKYVYSHAGYNLKITDMQAAVGLAQMDRLEQFISIRKRNFAFLKKKFAGLEEFFILPEATPGSDPAWFGFPLTLRSKAPFTREELLLHLDQKRIGTRLLFAGNITQQPYFKGRKYRISGDLKNSDTIMRNTFWLGVYPGLTKAMLDYAGDAVGNFVRRSRG
ncbi:MAG: lipopolysaccharide biosynthesis protein RfbH [Candidatus Omnitrophota bacterium]